MAAIDKTYLKRWKDYVTLKSWLQSVGKVTDDFGNVFRPIDFLLDRDEEEFNKIIDGQIIRTKKMYSDGHYHTLLIEGIITQEELDNFIPFNHIGGVCIWNTPRFFDVWLIHNCPFDFIQDRLKEQYSDYDQIKSRKSKYDTYCRNGLGRKIHVNKSSFPRFKRKLTSKIHTSIKIDFPGNKLLFTNYNNDHDYWFSYDDLRHNIGHTSSWFYCQKYMTSKAMFRKLQKWDLPEGSKAHVEYYFKYTSEGPAFCKEFDLIIRKK